MAVQSYTYKKISELPSVTSVIGSDLFIVNATNKTSKITWGELLALVEQELTPELTELQNKVTALETAYSSLATDVANNTATINNIITAGFNLIGIE